MNGNQLAFVALNVIGGSAVLSSYAWGLNALAPSPDRLWGNLPDSFRWLYTTWMFVAAAGYFPATWVALNALGSTESRIGERPNCQLFFLLYGLILLPSAAWLPLTISMIESPARSTWILTRVDLALVAVGSTGLIIALRALRGLSPAPSPSLHRAAVIGAVALWFQTAILDALIWPEFFLS
jgi:hypothetical protein